jgi:hypothetical protein
VLEAFAERTTARLDAAGSILAGEPPSPAATVGWDADADELAALDPVLRARLTRLARQVDTLVNAATEVAAIGAGIRLESPLITPRRRRAL